MRTSLFAVLILSFAAACGESHDAPGDDAAVDGSGGDSGGGTTDSGGGTTDSGGTVDSGGGTVDSGGGSTDGGGPTDGGVIVVDASPTDAGGPTDGGTGRIECGMTTCNARTEQCCLGGGAGGATAMCIPIGDMCMGVATDCDGPEDCPRGQVCCASRSGTGFSVSCADSCGGGGTVGGGFELCHDAMDCTDGGDMCCPFAFGGISGAFCSPMCFGTMP